MREEKEALKASELQDKNAMLQQEVCRLRREVREMKWTVRGLLVKEDHCWRLLRNTASSQ